MDINLSKDIEEVRDLFPKLIFENDRYIWTCQGEIDIFDRAGNYWDSFEIRFRISSIKYPHVFPALYEVSSKIPKIADRHMNLDGSCCLTVIQRQKIEEQKGITIKDYLLQYVYPYFANQIFFEKEDHWANGDYQHGIFGIIQFYKEETGLQNMDDILSLIENIEVKQDRNTACFCGSGKKFKHCHSRMLDTIKKIPTKQLMYDYRLLYRYTELTKDY